MQNNDWSRREFLVSIPCMVAGMTALAHGEAGTTGQGVAVKWSAGTELPLLKVPANATDCHHHIYDTRFPYDPKAMLKPARGHSSRLPATSEAPRHHPQCNCAAFDLRCGQPLLGRFT